MSKKPCPSYIYTQYTKMDKTYWAYGTIVMRAIINIDLIRLDSIKRIIRTNQQH